MKPGLNPRPAGPPPPSSLNWSPPGMRPQAGHLVRFPCSGEPTVGMTSVPQARGGDPQPSFEIEGQHSGPSLRKQSHDSLQLTDSSAVGRRWQRSKSTARDQTPAWSIVELRTLTSTGWGQGGGGYYSGCKGPVNRCPRDSVFPQETI